MRERLRAQHIGQSTFAQTKRFFDQLCVIAGEGGS
jgi:hypothetical protein